MKTLKEIRDKVVRDHSLHFNDYAEMQTILIKRGNVSLALKISEDIMEKVAKEYAKEALLELKKELDVDFEL